MRLHLLVPFVAASALAATSLEVPVRLPSGKVLRSEVMVKDEDRARGLMYRDSLAADRGMLFVFDEVNHHTIWMKNCRFPIDIVWLDAKRKVVDVKEGAPPCLSEPCATYAPRRPAAYVLEINAGQARRERVKVGSRLDFPELPLGR